MNIPAARVRFPSRKTGSPEAPSNRHRCAFADQDAGARNAGRWSEPCPTTRRRIRTGQALEKGRAILHPIVVTDSPDLVRKVRSEEQKTGQARHILLIVADRDSEGPTGFQTGATDCIGRDASQECFRANLAIARRILELEASLQAAIVHSRELSTIDELTRVASRLFFFRHFPREAARATSGRGALSVVICDIDHLKRINDTYGHPAGDQVLRELFRLADQEIAVTASFGVCGLDVASPADTNLADYLLKVADAALYHSKRNGRNRVTTTRLRTKA